MSHEIESLSREFAKLAGICWHEPNFGVFIHGDPVCVHCGKKGVTNPDFSDACEVIRVMRERGIGMSSCNTYRLTGRRHTSYFPVGHQARANTTLRTTL